MATSPGVHDSPGRSAPVVAIDSGGHRERVIARRNELVTQYAPMVRSLARKLHRRLPSCFDLDDLVAVGDLALLQAATRFRPSAWPGVAFSLFARPAVHGAMIRSVSGRHWQNATCDLLDDKVREIRSPAPAPDETVLVRRVRAAIELLPAAERSVMKAVYAPDEPSIEAVGIRMGIPPHKAYRLHRSAIDHVRNVLKAVV